MADVALERIKPTDETRRDAMLRLKLDIQQAQEELIDNARPVRSIVRLPVELLCVTFSLALLNNPAFPVVASHVCKYWREVALGFTPFWSRLTFPQRRLPEKVAMWKERTRDNITCICVPKQISAMDYTQLREAISTINTRSLTELVLHGAFGLLATLQRGPLSNSLPNLRNLTIKSEQPCTLDGFSQFSSPGGNVLRSLVLHNIQPVHLESAVLVLRVLELKLSTNPSPALLWGLLSRGKDLNRVHLEFTDNNEMLLEAGFEPTTLELPWLTHLSLSGFNPMHFFTHVLAPNLSTLHLDATRRADHSDILLHFVRSRLPSTEITNLRMRRGTHNAQDLVKILASLPELRSLEISQTTSPLNAVLEALSESPTTITDARICPYLQHVNFSHYPLLEGRHVRDLVKSRLPLLNGSGDQVAAPLQSVMIDGCPLVEPEILPWLRANVKNVSCVYQTKKEAMQNRPRRER